MIRIPMQPSWSRRPAAPYARWASFGCRCLSSSTELEAAAGVDLVEEGQVEVAVAPLAVLVIDTRLLALAKHTLLWARWRHLGQRASVIQGVDDLDLRLFVAMHLVTVLATENLVAREDQLGW